MARGEAVNVALEYTAASSKYTVFTGGDSCGVGYIGEDVAVVAAKRGILFPLGIWRRV